MHVSLLNSAHFTTFASARAVYALHTGRMEKQETDTDAESGNGHGKWKILHALALAMSRHASTTLLDARL